MYFKKQYFAIVVICAITIVGIAATKPPRSLHKNLKILPADISEKKLDSIMNSYNVALGVNCDFCHAPVQGFPDSLDFAVDTKPMKEEARKMMRMTIKLNTENFYFDKAERPEYLKVVQCMTCHRGEAYPDL